MDILCVFFLFFPDNKIRYVAYDVRFDFIVDDIRPKSVKVLICIFQNNSILAQYDSNKKLNKNKLNFIKN